MYTKRYVINEMVVLIIDGVLSSEDVKSIHRALLLSSFSFLGATSHDSAFDEVMASFEPSDFQSTGIGQKALEIVKNQDLDVEYELYEVLCNMSRFGDVSFGHIDSHDPTHLSLLYFANSSWDMKWEGELIFFTESNEPIRALSVRPGRFALFPCCLRHRAGVPNRLATEQRLTVSMRFRPLHKN